MLLVCNKYDLIEEKLKGDSEFAAGFEKLKSRIKDLVEEKNLNYIDCMDSQFICALDHEQVKATTFELAKKFI